MAGMGSTCGSTAEVILKKSRPHEARHGVTLTLVGGHGSDEGPSRRQDDRAPQPDARVLATVLFTDVVDSTGHAIDLGDEQWLALLERHETMLQTEIRRFGGHPLSAVGDGVVATFGGAASAIRCATHLAQASRSLGLEVRCGLHCGEYERRGPRVGGIVFHVASRVMSLAAPGKVLVSETVKQLVAGSTLRFAPRGRRVLRGLPGLWPIYDVIDEARATI